MMPGNDRARPLVKGGLDVESSWGLSDRATLPLTGVKRGARNADPARLPLPPTSVVTFDLLSLSHREREVWDSGYHSGVVVGIDMGRRQVEDEGHVAWQRMADSIRRMGGPFHGLRFSELCDLRGEHERADLARARERLLFDRQVAS